MTSGFTGANTVSSIGDFLLGASTLPLPYNVQPQPTQPPFRRHVHQSKERFRCPTRVRSAFSVNVPEEDLVELRRRIAAARWPSKELVADRSQGVQLATLQELARYWATEYDWRACETRLNALPQFTTTIDGVDIHFLHVKSQHENALPLIMTHGWPGSVIELLETVGPLTDPTAHGGAATDAFDLVLPSLSGYGFSGEPTDLGWDPGHTARAWAELIQRLGYTRYVAQGGDLGAAVTDAIGRQAPRGWLASISTCSSRRSVSRTNCRRSPSRNARRTTRSTRSRRRLRLLRGAGHPAPDDRLCPADTPVALAAWLLDHDTDSYQKISRAFVDGQPAGNLTRDHILDNITLYWLTGTRASAARWYWELGRAQAIAAGQAPPAVSGPVGFTTFPARSSLPRAAGSSRSARTSPTSTRPTGAATSPPGKSPSCSPRKSERRSGHSGSRAAHCAMIAGLRMGPLT